MALITDGERKLEDSVFLCLLIVRGVQDKRVHLPGRAGGPGG